MKIGLFNSKILWLSRDFSSSLFLYDTLCHAKINCEIYYLPNYSYGPYPYLLDVNFLNEIKENELSFIIRVSKQDFEKAKQIVQYLF